MFALPVFYYSSTIIAIDDSPLFLNALSQMLSNTLPIKIFDHPEQCIAFFKKYISPLKKINFLHDCVEHDYYGTINHTPVDFDVTSLYQLHQYAERTHEISVMIVDYDMPGMNGVELCRKIRMPLLKKILLTGKADHHTAVRAFNENSIDRFIRKDSPTLIHDIRTYITSLTQEYFRQYTKVLLSHLEVNHPIPLSDPIFIDFFQSWCNENHITEYYLIDKHGSFVARNEKNQPIYFIVHTDRTLDAFIQLNDDIHNADILLEDIKNRQKIPFFGVGKESWHFKTDTWVHYFHPLDMLKGRENYYWTALKTEDF